MVGIFGEMKLRAVSLFKMAHNEKSINNMSTFKQIYLAYILICMVYHFYTVAMSYRRASKSKI